MAMRSAVASSFEPNARKLRLAREGPARHVIDLLADSDGRAEMARRARAVAEANYRWEAQLACLDQVIAAVSDHCGQQLPRIAC
jgi:hypothetical protein